MFPIIRLEPFDVKLDHFDQPVTVYPVTVEFDRLLRRQQQLERSGVCSANSNNNNSCTTSSHIQRNTSVRSSVSSELSLSSSSASIGVELTTPLENVNMNDLLFGTLIYFYGNLHCHEHEENEFLSTNDSPPLLPLQPCVDEIFRIIASPGTRTTLFLIDKPDVIKSLEGKRIQQTGVGSVGTTNATSTVSGDKTVRHSFKEIVESGVNSSISEECLESISTKIPLSVQQTAATVNMDQRRAKQIESIIFACDFRDQDLQILGDCGESGGVKATTAEHDSSEMLHQPHHQQHFHQQHGCRKQFRELDNFLCRAETRKRNLLSRLLLTAASKTTDNCSDAAQPPLPDVDTLVSVGVEQQIVGAITFFKSYRLTGMKIIETPLLSVMPDWRRHGLGSRLLTTVKENGQIGPYDAIRVKTDSFRNDQRRFFLANEFSDDLILNASFDQLHSVYSDGDEEADELENGENEVDEDDEAASLEYQRGVHYDDEHQREQPLAHRMSTNRSANIQHSASLGNFQRPLFQQSPISTFRPVHRQNGFKYRRSNRESGAVAMGRHPERTLKNARCKQLSLCYLPPFATSTATNSCATFDSIERFRDSQTILDEIESRQVDDMIEDAHRLWRRELLSAYRTQWSCVARLRAEIHRLRRKVRESDDAIVALKRDNHQLRTSLLQSESKINSQKHLFLLKNFNFDSMDF